MTNTLHRFLILLFFFSTSCKTNPLKVIVDIPSSLKEISAIEIVPSSNLYWVIEDSGNANKIYGLDSKGKIIKDILISNAKNVDWEDLTTDKQGNIYIGDFGNNSKNRGFLVIYKVANITKTVNHTTAEAIHFQLPKGKKAKDFEAFFLWKNHFYLFSKEAKKSNLFKIPNKEGYHQAEFISEYHFEKKKTKITSADISDDGKTIVLLTSNKLFTLTDYKEENFFSGKLNTFSLNHDSQKEGVCFKNISKILITDESKKNVDGNIYLFNLH